VKFLDISTYMSTYKQSAILYTVASHIRNMFKGVTKGFRYKMHIVKKHFPIEIKVNKESIEIGRFLGERIVKVVKLLEGVSVSKNEKNPEELYFDGNDIDKVSLGDWGLGIGDWGLGIGDWGLGPIPNPQSPIPNPQSPLNLNLH
jgi:large subunit ribosomal protein L9e